MGHTVPHFSQLPVRMDVYALIDAACELHGQRKVAALLEVTPRTVRRWQGRETAPPPYLSDAIRERVLPHAKRNPDAAPARFRFADLFAGIGGMRAGFEAHGGRCVFTSEWNPFAQKTYLANFAPTPDHVFTGDITQVDTHDVPDHDVLLAGFPCQPFSIAGVSKKNALGRAHGFADETQGTLFFDVARILAAKRPHAFLLENVKNLLSHDRGNTFRVIERTLRDELGYRIHSRVVDGACFVPQHRERILIAGFRDGTDFSWDDLHLPSAGPLLASILHPEDGSEAAESHYTVGPAAEVDARYTLTPRLWTYLQNYARKHRAAGNGFGYGLFDGGGVARTLSARYYKDGSEILISRGRSKQPRRLTPRECARLMGFDATFRRAFGRDFRIPVSDTQAYRQFGNSVVVPVIEEVARIMAPRVIDLIEEDRAVVRQPSLLAG